jgi:hypothetical protein
VARTVRHRGPEPVRYPVTARRDLRVAPSRGRSSMVEPQPSKLVMRVRFPSPAPLKTPGQRPTRSRPGRSGDAPASPRAINVPLPRCHEVIVNTVAATTTRTGLRVHAELDPGSYPDGVKVSDEQMARLPLNSHGWHGDWNYTLRPELFGVVTGTIAKAVGGPWRRGVPAKRGLAGRVRVVTGRRVRRWVCCPCTPRRRDRVPGWRRMSWVSSRMHSRARSRLLPPDWQRSGGRAGCGA